MTQTFTPRPTLTETPKKNETENVFNDDKGPSDSVIRTILSFSKNLEIRQSRLLPALELIRS